MPKKDAQDLNEEIQELRSRLQEAQDTLDAIRRGEVDGVVVYTPKGEQVYTISGAEKPYRALIEEMREGAVMLSDDNAILYCNSGFAKIVRCPLEKIVGLNIESMISPTNRIAFKKMLSSARTQKSEITEEITLQASDHGVVPTLMSINSLQMDTLTNTFLVVTDLTEHMEEEVKKYTSELELAQIALSESEERWATTLASIGDAVIATNVSGKITFMNGVAEELTGWTLDKVVRRPVQEIFKIINEFTRKIVEDPVAKVLEKGMIVGLANHTILVRKDGTEVAIDDSGAPIRDKTGKVTGVVLVFRDITERKRAEQALKASEQKANDLIRYAPSGIYELDYRIPPTFRSVNDAMCQILGYTREELLATSPFTLLDDEGKIRFRERIIKMLAGEKVDETVEFKVIPKDGRELFAVLNVTFTYKDGKPDGALVIAHDVTERKKAEMELEKRAKNLESLVEERTKALRDSERLAAIGATAGMVGHDIRNPLQAITGDLYLAKADLALMPESEEKESLKESLTAIEQNAEYINKIVADLQDFVKPLSPKAEETDLKAVINELLSKNGLPENINEQVQVENEATTIMADPAFVKRIIGNLLSNAVQAMPNGGNLAIAVSKESDYTVITVSDTGVGIPDNVKSKLFQPLFTTKSKGQGFGLAVVKRMTEALGGTVTYESQVAKGTKFIVRLPPPKEIKGKWTFK